MKKIFSLFLIATMLILAVGCSPDKDSKKTSENVQETKTEALETEAPDSEEEPDSEEIPETEVLDSEVPESEAFEDEQDEAGQVVEVDISYPIDLMYSSGAGAWYAHPIFKEHGTFQGENFDFDAGKYYTSKYSGVYYLEKINDYSYTLTFGDFTYLDEPGSVWSEGEIEYEATTSVGFEDSDEFVLYTPDTPVSELDEEFLFWYHGGELGETLGCYALRNPVSESGYFSY